MTSKRELTNKLGDPLGYDLRGIAEWLEYEEGLRDDNRFFAKDAAYFDQLLNECLAAKVELPRGTLLFRARVMPIERTACKRGASRVVSGRVRIKLFALARGLSRTESVHHALTALGECAREEAPDKDSVSGRISSEPIRTKYRRMADTRSLELRRVRWIPSLD